MRFFPALLLFGSLTLPAADWPRFRGPNGTGVDPTSSAYPVEFGPAKNAAWKTNVPFGRSSPILVGQRVFLTASEGDLLSTLCYSAADGKLLWRRDVKRAHKLETFRANDPASPSATADASGVYVFFAEFGLIGYSLDGQERWRVPLGPFDNFYGMASSPVLAGDLVILACDQTKGSYLLAVDKNSGKQRWKSERPDMPMGWGVPIVHRPTGQPPQLILMGSTRVDSYSLATGERRWWLPYSTDGAMGVPVVDGDSLLLYSSGSDQQSLEDFVALLAKYDTDKDGKVSRQEFQAYTDLAEHFGWPDANKDGFIEAKEWAAILAYGPVGEYGVTRVTPGSVSGALPKTAVAWRVKGKVPYVPAPVLYRGVYFMVKDGGIVTSLDPASGKVLKQGRAAQSLGQYLASPVAADGKVYLLSEEGKLTVLKADAEWDVLAVNDLQEEAYSTPALADGRIYVRTRSALYCFAKPDKP